MLLFSGTALASKWQMIKYGGGATAVATGAVLFGLEETANQYVIDISEDQETTSLTVSQRFVLDPDEPLDSQQRNIFVDNVRVIKSLGLSRRLFWIRADSYDNFPPFGPTRFTVDGPLVQKAGFGPESMEISYGGTGTIRFPGLMNVKIEKPDLELSAVGIEGFTITFEKKAIDTLIQGVQSKDESASRIAAKLAGKQPPPSTTKPPTTSPPTTPPDGPDGETPEPAPPTKDKWFKLG